jgi:hypothetical protein
MRDERNTFIGSHPISIGKVQCIKRGYAFWEDALREE